MNTRVTRAHSPLAPCLSVSPQARGVSCRCLTSSSWEAPFDEQEMRETKGLYCAPVRSEPNGRTCSLALGSRSMVTRARRPPLPSRETDRACPASLVAKPAPLAAPWVSRRILLCLLTKTEPADGEPVAELGDADHGVIAGRHELEGVGGHVTQLLFPQRLVIDHLLYVRDELRNGETREAHISDRRGGAGELSRTRRVPLTSWREIAPSFALESHARSRSTGPMAA